MEVKTRATYVKRGTHNFTEHETEVEWCPPPPPHPRELLIELMKFKFFFNPTLGAGFIKIFEFHQLYQKLLVGVGALYLCLIFCKTVYVLQTERAKISLMHDTSSSKFGTTEICSHNFDPSTHQPIDKAKHNPF